jgi:hypothetical protein
VRIENMGAAREAPFEASGHPRSCHRHRGRSRRPQP